MDKGAARNPIGTAGKTIARDARAALLSKRGIESKHTATRRRSAPSWPVIHPLYRPGRRREFANTKALSAARQRDGAIETLKFFLVQDARQALTAGRPALLKSIVLRSTYRNLRSLWKRAAGFVSTGKKNVAGNVHRLAIRLKRTLLGTANKLALRIRGTLRPWEEVSGELRCSARSAHGWLAGRILGLPDATPEWSALARPLTRRNKPSGATANKDRSASHSDGRSTGTKPPLSGHTNPSTRRARRTPTAKKRDRHGPAEFWRGVSSLPGSVIFSSLLINILGLALPLVMLQIYDRILPNKSVETLALLMIGLGTVVVLEAALKATRSYIMGWAATRQAFASEVDSVRRILVAPIREIDRETSAKWMDRLDALNQLNSFSSGQSRLILLDLPFVVIFLTMTWLVGGALVLVLLAMIGIFATYVAFRARAISNGLLARTQHDARRDDFITESISGIHTIKSLAMEPQMQRRLERLQQSTATISHRNTLMSNEFQTASALFGNLILISMVTCGAILVIWGNLTIGALACCTLLTSRVLQPVMRGMQVWMELENAHIARRRAEGLFALPLPEASRQEIEPVGSGGSISIANASLHYSNPPVTILSGINLTVGAGEMIGIRGGHASGKSSLLKLISGEVPVTEGEVRVNGRVVDGGAATATARRISTVSQDAAIFRGSILENITMFRAGEAVGRAREAACMIGLEKDIHKLPQGYDTLLGAGLGNVLPAGMLQRIAIARALASKPEILLFDEANSLLDMTADRELREGFEWLKGAFTIILVSNRPSLLAVADRRFELVGGKLVTLEERDEAPQNTSASVSANA